LVLNDGHDIQKNLINIFSAKRLVWKNNEYIWKLYSFMKMSVIGT
jgi:hypothetical protein